MKTYSLFLIIFTVGSTLAHDFVVKTLLQRGKDSKIYFGSAVNLQNVAIKVVKYNPSITNYVPMSLRREYEILTELNKNARVKSLKAVPKVLGYHALKVSDSVGYEMMAMELLSDDMEEVLTKNDRTMDAPTHLHISVTLVKSLEAIHTAGFVHRDLKPKNMALRYGRINRKQIPILDWEMGEKVSNITGDCDVGTTNYQSVSSHVGGKVGKKEDMESLLYVLVELCLQKLPWDLNTCPPEDISNDYYLFTYEAKVMFLHHLAPGAFILMDDHDGECMLGKILRNKPATTMKDAKKRDIINKKLDELSDDIMYFISEMKTQCLGLVEYAAALASTDFKKKTTIANYKGLMAPFQTYLQNVHTKDLQLDGIIEEYDSADATDIENLGPEASFKIEAEDLVAAIAAASPAPVASSSSPNRRTANRVKMPITPPIPTWTPDTPSPRHTKSGKRKALPEDVTEEGRKKKT